MGAQMRISKKRPLPPDLARPLAPLKLGLLASKEFAEEALRNRSAIKIARLELLRQHYGIPPGPGAFASLAMALAEEYIAGFQERKPRGRPQTWSAFESAMLAGEMKREIDTGLSALGAARRIAAREPWLSFLKDRRWRTGTRGSDIGEALRKHHELMPTRYRMVGEEAYQYRVAMNTLSEWDGLVKLILSPPSS